MVAKAYLSGLEGLDLANKAGLQRMTYAEGVKADGLAWRPQWLANSSESFARYLEAAHQFKAADRARGCGIRASLAKLHCGDHRRLVGRAKMVIHHCGIEGCPRCSRATANRARKELTTNALAVARHHGPRKPGQPGRPKYTLKHLVFTSPPPAEMSADGLAQQVRWLWRAWSRWWKRYGSRIDAGRGPKGRKKRNPRTGAWARLEIGEKSGHPHLHVIWLGPWVSNTTGEDHRDERTDSFLSKSWAASSAGLDERYPEGWSVCYVNALYGFNSKRDRAIAKHWRGKAESAKAAGDPVSAAKFAKMAQSYRHLVRDGNPRTIAAAVAECAKYLTKECSDNPPTPDGAPWSWWVSIALRGLPRSRSVGTFRGAKLREALIAVGELDSCPICGSEDVQWWHTESVALPVLLEQLGKMPLGPPAAPL